MPDLGAVSPCWQFLYKKISVPVAHRKIWRIRHDDRSAHPGMEHIAIDSYDSEAIQPFRNLPPSWQANVEQSLFAQTRVHCVKNRIAVLEQQFAARRGYLDVRRKGALLIVEN